MNLSDDRINHLSHLILKSLKDNGGARYGDEAKALLGIKKAIHDFGEVTESIDTQVRAKIATLKRQVQEGSREWDLLYKQYFTEELAKKGL